MDKIGSSLEYLREAIFLSQRQINLSEEARAENILGVINWKQNNLEVAEHYLNKALSNCELANNHRWLWRIRTNMSQVSFLNKNSDKSYNICWAVVDHLLKTKDALSYEAANSKINSRRFAALKAISLVLYRMGQIEDLERLKRLFHIPQFSKFLHNLSIHNGSLAFDGKDQNLFEKNYFILG